MTNQDKKNKNCLCSMLGDFYNKENLPIAIFTLFWAVIIIAIAIWSAYKFSKAQEIKQIITFSMIFICCFIFIAVIKIFAWQIINRTYIKRRIEQLEQKLTKP